jgi:DNA-binding transcriptional MerR regulator
MEDYREFGGGDARTGSTGADKSAEHDTSWGFASIGEVAEEFGFTLRALRFYEEKGLISPRRSGNRRLYSPRDRRRLEIIAQGKRIGLALEEIREILRAGGDAGSRRHLEVALDKCLSRVDEIHVEQKELKENLEEAVLLIGDLKSRLGKSN